MTTHVKELLENEGYQSILSKRLFIFIMELENQGLIDSHQALMKADLGELV